MSFLKSIDEDHDVKAPKKRAPRNRTLEVREVEAKALRERLLYVEDLKSESILGRTVLGDCFRAFDALPRAIVDLLVLDPPYNLNKKFGGSTFSRVPVAEYTKWLRRLFLAVKPLLKTTATVYICGDWFTSASIFEAASEHFTVRNRITWEREKGRGALTNWKNSSEDIWFCTVSDSFAFNVDAVKMRRRVIAPYRDADGQPKDWNETSNGNFRDTHPSNIWTDITIPFWSMPENTDHPTQKSEKLIAKLVLASSNPGELVFDPFLGSGTTSVVAKKLGRQYCGIELDEAYALLAEKRLLLAESDRQIQGYSERVFWERNTLNVINSRTKGEGDLLPFDDGSQLAFDFRDSRQTQCRDSSGRGVENDR
jgi:site-specific DNA-methyltransferase (adenine-specific)